MYIYIRQNYNQWTNINKMHKNNNIKMLKSQIIYTGNDNPQTLHAAHPYVGKSVRSTLETCI